MSPERTVRTVSGSYTAHRAGTVQLIHFGACLLESGVVAGGRRRRVGVARGAGYAREARSRADRARSAGRHAVAALRQQGPTGLERRGHARVARVEPRSLALG